MKTIIEIYCEDETELFQHLTQIRRKLRKELKEQSILDGTPIEFENENCYGSHNVIVNFD